MNKAEWKARRELQEQGDRYFQMYIAMYKEVKCLQKAIRRKNKLITRLRKPDALEETALDVILNELTRLRTEVGQLKGQIRIKDTQISELQKQVANQND